MNDLWVWMAGGQDGQVREGEGGREQGHAAAGRVAAHTRRCVEP